MESKRASFEGALEALGVTVSSTSESELEAAVTEAVTEPAVGVALDETVGDGTFSLVETPITVDPTPAALREATTGVTGAELGVGDYGSLVLSMTEQASELVSLFVERHVAILYEEDIQPDMDAAVAELDERFTETNGSAIIATGPSATADMGALVKGAHGPKEVHVIVVEEED
ncbi:L-lactate dehydrogenase complex protein LldG [Haloarcula quadrata]|uniref:L-lactate dehydrogenase complex protein LldG n=1 Tax=Haloarcula quadrata TaxID=182779 RepID=A0A495QWC4_9EURY|nr:LUD domain-containing protein [Haloarcula quadrata]RKS78377.1 L-lactate dehydrogenase complex protein LldG [Haloarcula quadrata]